MFKQELLRYYKSKFSIVFGIVLSLVVVVNYYSTYIEKKDWLRVMNSGAEDANLEKVAAIVEGFNGLFYFERFLFSNDYFVIFCIVLLLGFGISIGPQVFASIQSNYGTMIISRLSYSKYLKQVLLAQVVYMFTYIALLFLLVLVVTLLYFGLDFTISGSSIFKGMDTLQFFLVCFGAIMLMSLYVVTTLLITSISPLFLRNKYIVQLFPLLVVMITYIASNIFGNFGDILSLLALYITLDHIILSIKFMYTSNQSILSSIMHSFAYIVSCMIIFIVLLRVNIKKFGKDYMI